MDDVKCRGRNYCIVGMELALAVRLVCMLLNDGIETIVLQVWILAMVVKLVWIYYISPKCWR